MNKPGFMSIYSLFTRRLLQILLGPLQDSPLLRLKFGLDAGRLMH